MLSQQSLINITAIQNDTKTKIHHTQLQSDEPINTTTVVNMQYTKTYDLHEERMLKNQQQNQIYPINSQNDRKLDAQIGKKKKIPLKNKFRGIVLFNVLSQFSKKFQLHLFQQSIGRIRHYNERFRHEKMMGNINELQIRVNVVKITILKTLLQQSTTKIMKECWNHLFQN